jgi:thiol-disulfide isomerase/thioredoxin
MFRHSLEDKGLAMSGLVKSIFVALVLGGCIIPSGNAQSADRPVAAILADLKDQESKAPARPDAKQARDAEFRKSYLARMQEFMSKKAALAFELYNVAPDHERIPELMVERWRTAGTTKSVETIKEIDAVLAKTNNAKFKLDATCAKARIKLDRSRSSGTPDLSGIDEIVKLAPKDPTAATLLYSASYFVKDKQAKAAIEDRILKDFPDSMYAGMVAGARHKNDSVGKPFDLEFTDAIKGTTLSIKGLKGKVVVIDFWATWCGPCVAEMPKMKELYAKYRDQGVEFIGVSLDQTKEQGGLDKLKKFVAEKEITWPQYYQGKGWESEFSMSWGINSIPCVFMVDTEGKLYSVEARGKLEEMIPELLAKKAKLTSARAGGN